MKRSDIASGSTDRGFIANNVLGTGDHVCVAASCLGFVLSTDRHGGYERRNSRQRRTSDRATLADVFAAEGLPRTDLFIFILLHISNLRFGVLVDGFEEVQRFFEISVNSSYEGFIFKTLNIHAAYEPSRQSNNWLKLKRAYLEGLGDSLDLVPIAAYYGHGKRTGVYGTFVLACYDTNKEEFQSISKIGKGFSDALLDERSAGLGSKVIPKPKSYLRFSERLNPDVWFEPTKIEEPCVSRLEKADFGFYLIFTYFFKNEEPCVSKLEKTDLDPHLIYEASLERGFISKDYFTTDLLCRQWLADGLKNPLEICGWLFFISYYI
ncbi:hypothetical protein OROMI_026513 [Orobanche minor]